MDVKMVILVPVTKVSNLGRIRTGLTDILEFWKFWILFANLLTNMLALYRWLNRKEIGFASCLPTGATNTSQLLI